MTTATIPMLARHGDGVPLDVHADDPSVWFEQKFDGDRLMVEVADGHVSFYGRNGQVKQSGVAGLAAAFAGLDDTVLDGELVQGRYHVFDMVAGPVGCHTPYAERRAALERLFTTWHPAVAALVYVARTPAEKRALMAATEASSAEGIIVKRTTAIYLPGRRSDGWIKAKYTHTADCVVLQTGVGINADGRVKENAELVLLDPDAATLDDQIVHVGRASTIGKRPTVEAGQVWEVTFLYWTGERLYQPRLTKLRTDKPMSECLIDQLVVGDSKTVV